MEIRNCLKLCTETMEILKYIYLIVRFKVYFNLHIVEKLLKGHIWRNIYIVNKDVSII